VAFEVQVLDHGFNPPGKNEWYTTHGDVFPIHGATMKPFGRHNGQRSFPSEERSKGFPEWNHYRIVCTNGVLRLHVNGKEVSGGKSAIIAKAIFALESEGAPVEFRNLRIRNFPSSGAPPELAAPVDLGWRTIFTGLDLRGWKTNAATAARWGASGETDCAQGRQRQYGKHALDRKGFWPMRSSCWIVIRQKPRQARKWRCQRCSCAVADGQRCGSKTGRCNTGHLSTFYRNRERPRGDGEAQRTRRRQRLTLPVGCAGGAVRLAYVHRRRGGNS